MLRACVAIAGLALVAGCQQYREMSRPPSTANAVPGVVVQPGYSFSPTSDLGWIMAHRTKDEVRIFRAGEHPDESILVQGMLLDLPALSGPEALVAEVRKEAEREDDVRRFKSARVEVARFYLRGEDCARTHSTVEDHAPSRRSGRKDPMLMQTLMLTCVHPANRRVGVRIAYSHRYYPENADARFLERADRVLRSLSLLKN